MTTNNRAHSLPSITSKVSDASQGLKNLNKLTAPAMKANTAVLVQNYLLESVALLRQLVKQHSLPVPDEFWSQTVGGVAVSADVSEPATVGSQTGPEVADLMSRLEESLKEKFVRAFHARYDGVCPECGNEIGMGELCVKTTLRNLHSKCWDEVSK